MTVQVRRGAARFVTVGPGWAGWCCFSYGEHYDPTNVSFGRMLACNEFVLEPGSGFGLHRHAGVDVVTTVLEGVLTHLPEGAARPPGDYVWGGGEHDERNEGDVPVRFVQAFLLPGADPRPQRVEDFAELPAMTHALVVRGAFSVGGEELVSGDSARLDEAARVEGEGLLLAWDCS